MALDQTIVDDVANSNFKVVANAAATGMAQAMALAAQDAVSHQRIINGLRETAFAEATLQRAGIDPSEAAATKKVTESDLGRTVSELGAVVASLQQMIKTAQSTPPETATE